MQHFAASAKGGGGQGHAARVVAIAKGHKNFLNFARPLTVHPYPPYMLVMTLITQSELKRRAVIDPSTGVCLDLSGRQLGTLTQRGYLRATINGREYRLHRLVWLWVHGKHPPENLTIDHINGVKTDNRIENLRLATVAQNIAYHHNKTRADPTMRNIYRERRGYRVEMQFNGKRIRRRAYTLERAIEVRDALFDLYPPIELR